MSLAGSACVHPNGWTPGSISGAGIGLRSVHIAQVLETRPEVPWFEVLADNHMAAGGLIPAQLAAVRGLYPLTFHCVGLSLAGTDPIDFAYLKRLKRMMQDFEPAWVSDHLCFTQFGGHHYHDLLPVPYTEETLNHIAARIEQVQDFLGERLLVENVSSYLEYTRSTFCEAEFIDELLKKADCHLLLDINNVFVNATNHGFSAAGYLNRIPPDRVREIHLAGYEDRDDYLLDAHNHRVAPPVWNLYRQVIQNAGDIPTLIEWDNDIPDFEVLMEEADQAAAILGDSRQPVVSRDAIG